MNRLFFLSWRLRHRLGVAVFALALLTASVSGREWFKSPKDISSSAPPSELKSLNTPQNDKRDRVEAEVITILPTGFQPSQITRSRGQFLILIDNKSDVDDLTYRLDSLAGEKLREMRQTKEQKIVRQLEDLPPGDYQLTASGGSEEWVCRITITPR